MNDPKQLVEELSKLARWHERQRDLLPWADGEGHGIAAKKHDKFARVAFYAALLIKDQLVEDK